MALFSRPEMSRGIKNSIDGALDIFRNINKAEGVIENSNPAPIDEYESSFSEEEVRELTSQWKKTYSVYYTPIEKSQETAFGYWLGKHKSDVNSNNDISSDNLIFEAIETFLPIATRANPDPLVQADPTEIGQQIARDIKTALSYEADTQKLRRKLARMTRHWVIYRIGVVKVSWDVFTKTIKTEVINPKRMIFDKDGYIDEGGNFVGEYLGEKKKATASRLIEFFPKKKSIIEGKAHNKLGTKLEYTEWWYKGTEVFYTMDEYVLGKYKNPNWNYDGNDPVTGEEIQGINHHKERKAPYTFLGVFSTGLQPHDETSLVLQNVSLQDNVDKTYNQIAKNVESQNNGIVVSGTYYSEAQAAEVSSFLRRGGTVRQPTGDVNAGFMRAPAPALPTDVYTHLKDTRSELRNIFGTSGSTAQGVKSEETARGKIMINQMDSSRIGGGVTEYIEQVADTIYNWWVQMMFVYYDEEHFVVSAGSIGGKELITLKNDKFPLLKTLNVTVKEGSLIPKDPLTQRNEAIDLWSANAIDPHSLYKKLDFPDPDEATRQLILWQMLQKGQIPPEAYLPSFQIQQPMGGLPPTQGTGGPAINPLMGTDVGAQAPQQTSPQAVQAQSQQLLSSVPIQ